MHGPRSARIAQRVAESETADRRAQQLDALEKHHALDDLAERLAAGPLGAVVYTGRATLGPDKWAERVYEYAAALRAEAAKRAPKPPADRAEDLAKQILAKVEELRVAPARVRGNDGEIEAPEKGGASS